MKDVRSEFVKQKTAIEDSLERSMQFEAMLKSQAQDAQEFKRPKKQGGNDAELRPISRQ